MSTFVGNPPVPGTLPDDIPTPPDTPIPDDPDEPIDEATDYEYSGTLTIPALNSYIAGKPDGATIGLEEEAEFDGDVDDQLHLEGRNGITLVCRNAILNRTARGNTQIFLADGGGQALKVYNLTVQGVNPDPGKWDGTKEHEHAFAIGGVIGWEFAGCRVINVGGDGLYVAGGNNKWAKNGRFHHGSMSGVGRMGIAITDGGRELVFDFNTFTLIGYYTWDIEPNGATVEGIAAGALNCRFSDNAIGTKPYGDYPDDGDQALGYLIASTGASGGGPAKGIQVLRNTMTDGAMRIGIFSGSMTNADWTITGNVGEGTFVPDGDISHVIDATNVSGLTVTGNTQLCTPDSAFISTSGCTSVTSTPNTI